jgi:two-component sensor histidine kinase
MKRSDVDGFASGLGAACGGDQGMTEERAQHFRSHMQRVISLLNLHIQYQDSARILDFVKKLRMRIELMAESLPLAVGASEPKATIGETFEAIEGIVSRIYDPDEKNSCDYVIADLSIDPPTLATLSQIFAEFLSNIYSRAASGGAPCRVAVKLVGSSDWAILSVFDGEVASGVDAEPLDLLTARVIGELARSLEAEAFFDRENIRDAWLSFPMLPR